MYPEAKAKLILDIHLDWKTGKLFLKGHRLLPLALSLHWIYIRGAPHDIEGRDYARTKMGVCGFLSFIQWAVYTLQAEPVQRST